MTIDIWYNKLSHQGNMPEFYQRVDMLKNNIEIDVKVKCIEADKTQAELARDIGSSAPYVSRLINNQDKIINKTFLSMMEALGYDVEINYVKRSGK